MSYILTSIWENVRTYDEKHYDKRLDGYFLLNKNFFVIVALYILFVKYLGPLLMANRKPFALKKILIIYNTFQIFINTYLLVVALIGIYVHRPYPKLSCMMPVRDNSDYGLLELQICYSYFLLKVFDFMDTIFFVLRKSFHQISFLHFFHHIAVSIGSYCTVRYYAGGHSSILGLINLFVHAIMYSYYLISVLKIGLAKHSWWKKYITLLQIVQFAINIIHHMRALFAPDCEYSKLFLVLIIILNIFMVILFSNFYRKTYIKNFKLE